MKLSNRQKKISYEAFNKEMRQEHIDKLNELFDMSLSREEMFELLYDSFLEMLIFDELMRNAYGGSK